MEYSQELDDHGRHPTMWTISAVTWVLENPDYRAAAKEVTMTRELQGVEVPDLDQAIAAAHELADKHAHQVGEFALEIWINPPQLRHADQERLGIKDYNLAPDARKRAALGIRLMETWADLQPQRVYEATQFRDGLMIALLICCPMRLRNLTETVIGRHLISEGEVYRLEFTATETKTGRPYVAAVPHELTTYLDYLQVHRPTSQSIALARGGSVGGRLWLGYLGKPLSSGGLERQIMLRTREAFGKAIWPHLFRDIAVTELVDCAPEEIGIAPDLLGHADLQTTKRHYIQAVGMKAHAACKR